MKNKIRIAAGQGFWGDLLDAPVRQVEGGPIDYLMLDYLAEVTMSIMQKQRSRDPAAGYAKDFIPLMKQILPACVERNIRVTANAGGVNVEGCAKAVREVAQELGLGDRWRLTFRARVRGYAEVVRSRPVQMRPQLTSVCLFSGGLDDFVGAIDLLATGEHPLLVSHYWENSTSSFPVKK